MVVPNNETERCHRRRALGAMVLIGCVYCFLLGRLFFLQGSKGRTLRAYAARGRTRDITLIGERGVILDRSGNPLAISLYSGTVVFDPHTLLGIPDPIRRTKRLIELDNKLPQIAAILHIDEMELRQFVHQKLGEYNPKKPCHYAPLRQKTVDIDTARALQQRQYGVLGFTVVDKPRRVYSGGAAAVQIVGLVSTDEKIALTGLEQGCNRWLTGVDGKDRIERDNIGRAIPDTLEHLTPARDGYEVHTTIDPNIQAMLAEEGAKVIENLHPKGVSLIALDPSTGDILGMVSLPTLDPSDTNTRRGLSKDALDNLLTERCATAIYEPGSTLKTMTIAAALDDDTISPNSVFYCSGSIKAGKRLIHCAHNEVHKAETPEDILRNSCNIGAAEIGRLLGGKRLEDADRRFGLFDPLDLWLPGKHKGYYSFDKNEKIYNDSKTMRVAFGHSISMTPLHVALAYAAIANDGILMKPRLLTEVCDSAGHAIEKWEPQQSRRVVSERTSAQVRSMLRAVVANGTAKNTALQGYQIAGKTGTAYKYKTNEYVGSFVGFLPASEEAVPRVVLLVSVDTPDVTKGHFGSDVAAPTFQTLAHRLMDYWKVPQDDPQSTQYAAAQSNLKKQARAH